MSVTSYACGICGAAFGCDGAAFAAHMRALHQIEMPTDRVMLAREEYDALTARAEASEQREAALREALAPILTYLVALVESADRQGHLPAGAAFDDRLSVVNDVWLRRSDIAALAAASLSRGDETEAG